MKAEYLQRGEALDYKNSTDAAIPAGAVIELVSRIGVAGTDIPAGALGSVHIVGVFVMPKKSSEEIKMGDPLYFDSKSEGGQLTKTGGEGITPAGFAAADAASEDATALVNIGFPPAAAAASGAGGDIDSKLANYQKKITASGILKGDGNGTITEAVAGTDYTGKITVKGILKGDGNGGVSQAQAGTDYANPSEAV